MRRLLFLLVALYLSTSFAPASAATYKCTDGRNITYSTEPCEELNLESSGTVRNKVTVMPATPTTQKKPEKQPEKSIQQMINENATGESADGQIHGGTTIMPVNPLIQKLLN
ncbi:MAG TPA: hypothetical protein VGD24_00790 [Gallionella sp.]